jgi:hypothetical protein
MAAYPWVDTKHQTALLVLAPSAILVPEPRGVQVAKYRRVPCALWG